MSKFLNLEKWLTRRKIHKIVFLLSGLYLIYWIVLCANPFFEGDDANILAGIMQSIRGFDNFSNYYRYHNQPLLYVSLIWLSKLFYLQPVHAAVGLSIISLATVFFVVYTLAKKIISESFAVYLLIACLFIHELIISGCYPNSSIFAMALFYLAVYFLVQFKFSLMSFILSAFFAVLSIFARNDAIFMLPCLFIIMSFKKNYLRIAIAVVVMILTGLVITYLLKVDFARAFSSAQRHFSNSPYFSLDIVKVRVLLLTMPLSIIILMFFGLIRGIGKKQHKVNVLVFFSCAPIFLFYFQKLTSGKYLLYLYPVFGYLAVNGWFMLKELAPQFIFRFIRCLIVILLIGQMMYTASPRSWFRKPNIYGRDWHFTADGPRPATGILFFPLNLKRYAQLREYNRKLLFSEEKGNNRVYWTKWADRGYLKYMLTKKAIKIERNPRDPMYGKTYILPKGVEVVVCLLPRKFYEKIDLFREYHMKGFYNIIHESHYGDASAYMSSNFSEAYSKDIFLGKTMEILAPKGFNKNN